MGQFFSEGPVRDDSSWVSKRLWVLSIQYSVSDVHSRRITVKFMSKWAFQKCPSPPWGAQTSVSRQFSAGFSLSDTQMPTNPKKRPF